MTGAQLSRSIGTLALRTPSEASALAASVEPVTADDLLRVLDGLQVRSPDPSQHPLRCALFVQLVGRFPDRKLFLPSVRALRTADPTLRDALTQVIPKVNDPGEHLELCAMLKLPDPGVRQATAQVLTKVGGRTVLATLTEYMRQSSFPARAVCIEIVVRIGGHHAIPALTGALPVASPAERQKIIRYLGDDNFMARDRVGALAALSALATDADESVAAAAIGGFTKLADEDEWFDHLLWVLEGTRLEQVRAAVRSLGRYSSRRVIEALGNRLRAGPKVIRMEVLSTLEVIATDAVIPPLVDALGHRQLDVRTRAADVLAKLGSSGKVDVARAVLWLLRSADAEVRRMAVEVARQTKDPTGELWPRLFEFLRDEDWWVRERVADALIEMAGPRVLGSMVGYLTDRSAPVRMFAIGVLGRMNATQALGALVRTASGDEDWWVRERAIETVGAMKDPRAGPYLVNILLKEPEMRLAALGALTALGSPDMAQHVARVLTDPSADVRLAALTCLESLNDRTQADAVRALVKDPDGPVRVLAQGLCGLWDVRFGVEVDASGTNPLDALLLKLADIGGDDLLLVPGRPASAKRMGRVEELAPGELDDAQIRALLTPLLRAQHVHELSARRDVDFSYEVVAKSLRFRANVFHQMGGMSAVFRIIRGTIPALETLGLPPVVARLGGLKNGLVLVGGPTGSGKSTTLAALLDQINRGAARHIITLEDPIEVVHGRAKSLVNQREIGTHTASYDAALRASLREDPDVILVGEMRDLDTISFAVSAAETGHLVLGTVHTVSADTTLDRMVNVFPNGQQEQVRSMLAGSLRAVVCQYLLPRADGQGRALACEVMLNNDAVAHLIRTGKTHQLPSILATSREAGMQLMDGDLMRLYREGAITAETAWVKSRNKKDFEPLLGGAAGRGA